MLIRCLKYQQKQALWSQAHYTYSSFEHLISLHSLYSLNMICFVCEKLLKRLGPEIKASNEGVSLPHHRTCRSLKDSVNEGCYICNSFWVTLTADQRDLISELHGSESITDFDNAGMMA